MKTSPTRLALGVLLPDNRKLIVGGLGASGSTLRLVGGGHGFDPEPLHLGGCDLRLDGSLDSFRRRRSGILISAFTLKFRASAGLRP